MFVRAFALTALLAPAPVAAPSPIQSEAAAPPPAALAPTPEPDPEALARARADVEVVLHDTSLAYVHARARLVADPVVGGLALLERLAAEPPPGPAQRKRLLDVLAELRRPEDLERFATELRRAVARAPGPAEALSAAERYRPLLVDQGVHAVAVLESLVGDRTLPIPVRGLLLADLIAVTPTQALPSYLALLGHGQRELQEILVRALTDRAQAHPKDAQAMLATLDAALATPKDLEARTFAATVQMRTRLSDADADLGERLAAIATDETQPFPHRIAAIDGLGRVHGDRALHDLAARALGTLPAMTQADEMIAATSLLRLRALDPDRAGTLVTEAALHESTAPRLATLGFAWGELPSDAAWLASALQNPWPEVRQAALERIVAPCPDGAVSRLAQRARDFAKPYEDRGAARSILAALGRCMTPAARRSLTRVLRDIDEDVDLRAEAARQLVRRGGPAGVDTVARMLRSSPGRRLERQLAVALRYASAPTRLSTHVLCVKSTSGTEVAVDAQTSLRHLHPQGDDVCDG